VVVTSANQSLERKFMEENEVKTILKNKSDQHVQVVKDQTRPRLLTIAPRTQTVIEIPDNDIQHLYYPWEQVTWKNDEKAKYAGFLKVECKERKDIKKEYSFPTIKILFEYGSPTWSIRLTDFSIYGSRGIPSWIPLRGIDMFSRMAECKLFKNEPVTEEIPDSSYPGGIRLRTTIKSRMEEPRSKEELEKLGKMRKKWRIQQTTDSRVIIE